MKKLSILLFLFLSSFAYGQKYVLTNDTLTINVVKNSAITFTIGKWLSNFTISGDSVKWDYQRNQDNSHFTLYLDKDSVTSPVMASSLALYDTLLKWTRNTTDTLGLSNRINLKVDSVKRKTASDSVFYYRNGAQVFAFIDSTGSGSVTVSDSAWMLTGNTGTTPTTNFVGTTDRKNLSFRTDNTLWMALDSIGKLILHGGYNPGRYDSTETNTSQFVTDFLAIGDSALLKGKNSTTDSLAPRTVIAIGRHALQECISCFNITAVGHDALKYLIGEYVTNTPFNPYGRGFEIAAFGNNTGHQCRTCRESTFIGVNAGYACYDCQGVTFVGTAAGSKNSAGANTFIGAFAGLENTTGSFNTFISGSSGQNNTTGTSNTYVGANAGFTNNSGGSNNVFGRDALYNNSNSVNSAFGTRAGVGNTSGNRNMYFGYEAGGRNTTLSNRWFFSNIDTYVTLTEDTTCWLYGIDNATNTSRQFKVSAKFGVRDGTEGKGKRFICDDATNGYGQWGVSAMDSTAGDAATQNATSGRVRKDTSGSTYTVTNSYCTVSSKITLTLGTTGVTAGNQISVLPQTGAFIITFETVGVAAAPNKDTDVHWQLEN